MPKEIKILAYTIKELEPKVKEKVLEKYFEINTDHAWYEPCYEGFKERLAEYGMHAHNFEWDLYRNEFSFKDLVIYNHDMLLSKLDIAKHLIPVELSIGKNYNIEFTADNTSKDGNFYVTVDITDDYAFSKNINQNIFDWSGDKGYNILLELEETISDKLSDLMDSLRSKFLKELRVDYEYYTSEEAVIDTLEANDYLFTKDGKQI